MWPGAIARQDPEHAACIMAGTGESVSYRELDERSNRLAHLLFDAGLRFGDHIAICMENHLRSLEVVWAAQRSGLYFTPINYHFNADEIAYIVENCDAQAYITSAAMAETAGALRDLLPERCAIRLMLDRPAGFEGYDDYEAAVSPFPSSPIAEELEGAAMVYSSGTTGRPKGVRYANPRRPMGDALGFAGLGRAYGLDEHCVYLSPAPLYHSAPLQFCIAVTRGGGTAVVMEHFDPEAALATIERYRVTHSQWVPTMFVRMLKLPAASRARYDLSSLKLAIHAAAPCPIPVKQQMIEWWGPILHEYYAATEGGGGTSITSEEWLTHPGSVGKATVCALHIVDEDGRELPPGEVGVVWFERGANQKLQFEYHKDPEKTAAAHDVHGWTTVGDMGYLDDEGYLYLTDRRDFMIVSGGVNIYPQEAENLLVTHPKVLDAAVFGVPNEEMGEEVKAVVQPIDMADAGRDLERELVAFCREHLAHYKCPLSVDFEAELPRQPTGKLYKRLLRDRYWGDRTSRIV